MSELNIFEQASRETLRFESAKGLLTVEHLWHLPLTSVKSVSLDSLAIATNRAIKEIGEESFVDTRPNPQLRNLKLQLDILKHIIDVKQAENAVKADAVKRATEIAQIEEALSSKREDALKGMTAEQLEAKLKELRS